MIERLFQVTDSLGGEQDNGWQGVAQALGVA